MNLSTTSHPQAPISPADLDLPPTQPIDVSQIIREQLAAEASAAVPAGERPSVDA